jgi:hypothetical protein
VSRARHSKTFPKNQRHLETIVSLIRFLGKVLTSTPRSIHPLEDPGLRAWSDLDEHGGQDRVVFWSSGDVATAGV